MPPAPPTDANESFATHQWKTEFASSRSGRNSPNIFAKVRRKLLLTPPVRNARSPRLTDEELDALTGALPYATNYTYAYSKIYDPSLPDHWEVPNLAGASSGQYLATQEHYSAASLTRQLLYLLRLPIYLFVHMITYILEAFYHIIKISTFTFWDYIVHLIKKVKLYYEEYLDNRRRTALIRNRQDPFKVKFTRFFVRIFEAVSYFLFTPVRLYLNRNKGVEQYNYTSIKERLENERASRMMTRSQAFERSRKVSGLSKSPARTPAVRTTTRTTITARVFTNTPVDSAPSTSSVPESRSIRNRSVTPRFTGTRGTLTRGNRGETPEVAVDTPLSTYGLRSRVVGHVNTPEPTFDVGNAMATSTPLFPNNREDLETSSILVKVANKASNLKPKSFLDAFFLVLSIVFFPFTIIKHLGYTFCDYAESAYMKYTDYTPSAMEPIYVRDENGELGSEMDEELGGEIERESTPKDNSVTVPWSTRILELFTSALTILKDVSYGALALLVGGIQEGGFYLVSGFYAIKEKASAMGGKSAGSSKFSWCHILGLLLALLLAVFLFGLLTSESTAIRVESLTKSSNEQLESSDHDDVSVPIFSKLIKLVWMKIKEAVWLAHEFVIDIVFAILNSGKSTASAVRNGFNSAYNFVVPPVYGVLAGVGTMIQEFFQSFDVFVTIQDYFITPILSGAKVIIDATKASFFYLVNSVYNGFNSAIAFFVDAPNAIQKVFTNVTDYASYVYRQYIYRTITAPFRFFLKHHLVIIQPVVEAIKITYEVLYVVAENVFWLFCRTYSLLLHIAAYPIGLITRALVHLSQYAPEEVIQVLPIPQSVTPTPENIEDRDPTYLEITRVQTFDENLNPSPPAPIQPPVIIQQTNVVETVDKEAIIKEVTEKLRAELTAQFHQELSAKFEQNYNSLVEQLKVENTNIQIDNSHLEGIIRQMIYEYDTDKTGQVDYALESSGGAVVTTRCSETYKSYTRLEKFWDIPIYYHHYSPRVVIQRNSKSLFPGECWCFKESRGYIAVELSHFIDVSSISYEHIGKEVAPEGNRSSAPKGILVWAYRQIDDINSRVLLGDYTYDLAGAPLQFFVAKHKPDFPVKFVELEVTSNYGAQFTCLYRLRVHGKMVKV